MNSFKLKQAANHNGQLATKHRTQLVFNYMLSLWHISCLQIHRLRREELVVPMDITERNNKFMEQLASSPATILLRPSLMRTIILHCTVQLG